MKKRRRLVWTAANALGLGVGFVFMLQTMMLFQYGFDWERHWEFVPPGRTLSVYAGTLVGALVGGLIFGSAQALVLRSRLLRVIPWILATTAGFGFIVVAVIWPLLATEIMGRIPGPVEPIIGTVGSCSAAGIIQYLVLRRQGIVASKWLAWWVVGVVVSLVPMALVFMSLEGMGLSLPWPIEVFLSGFIVAGVAALISGGALFTAISPDPE